MNIMKKVLVVSLRNKKNVQILVIRKVSRAQSGYFYP